MRIRKNAKNSTLVYSNASLSNDSDKCLVQMNLCQLNQSPWDIITFPSSNSSSSLHQFDDNEVYYNVNLAVNGTSVDSIGAFESVASVKNPEDERYDLDDLKNDYQEILGFKEEEKNGILEDIVLCGESDEKGWQCGKMVKNGNTMCDHHIIELQNDSIWTTKKKSRSGSGPINELMAGTRARQTKKGSSTSPYEFYYYSGFGPSWGKKRGAVGSNTTNAYNEPTKIMDMSLTDDDMNIGKDMVKTIEPKISKVGPTIMESATMDDNTKKGKTGIIGKKRGRKPMKARSLKSLM
ncbi:uncharacterized protein LOC111915383 [Lactuca sativa]|uniref:WRC domain-containing protein n=1 Tax=Lactuca sativa TaxID=4236 RepID=A0A9R1UXD9_LACSA|nr:uncharacterized protein LOC111915383 [Lactuca sativa]KAJ0195937.1 hypothetical protein LSAT_V11C700343980 [Lactuca sativa]